jgi:hypothetical protein
LHHCRLLTRASTELFLDAPSLQNLGLQRAVRLQQVLSSAMDPGVELVSGFPQRILQLLLPYRPMQLARERGNDPGYRA